MSIVLTNSLKLDVNKPLVSKDVINSDIDYITQNPLELTEEELLLVNSKYNVGYIVYDNYTKLHYKWSGLEKGWELLQDNYEEYVEEVIDSLDSVGTGVSSSGNISVTVRQIEGTIDSVIVEDNYSEIISNTIRGLLKKLVLTNPELTLVENNYAWIIPYNQLIENGIDIDTAVVYIREINTGKQLIADIVFDNNNSRLIIYFDNSEITANIYKAIILS
jgi:hypothetical protein